MTPVSKTEVKCLIRHYNQLLGQPAVPGRAVSGLDRGKFRSILHNIFRMTDDMIMDGGIILSAGDDTLACFKYYTYRQ